MLFAKHTQQQDYHKCKLCHRNVPQSEYYEEIGLCTVCIIVVDNFYNSYMAPAVDEYQKKANEATNLDDKMMYLKLLLNVLYEYKYKYEEEDVRIITDDADDLITSVLDVISRIRVEIA